MIRYFTNRQLANGLEINLARWKRWSREFLPPDPLGGLQSGFTRDYSIDDALTVYLGGCLVSGLKFTIPQARQILNDLEPWLMGAGVYINGTLQERYTSDIHLKVSEYLVYIYPETIPAAGQPDFRYLIKGILRQSSDQDVHTGLKVERYIEIDLAADRSNLIENENMYLKILNITATLRHFTSRLNLDANVFPIVNLKR